MATLELNRVPGTCSTQSLRGELQRELHDPFLSRFGSGQDPLETVRQLQGRFGEAERLLRRSLALREAAHGAESPAVASTLSQLASCLREAGREDEAVEYEDRAAAIRASERAGG